MERFLIRDLTNLISEYVEYDQAKQLRLPIRRDRVRVDSESQGQAKRTFVDGLLRREEGWWLSTGIKESSTRFLSECVKHGTSYQWYQNGIRKSQRTYLNNMEDGLQYYWDKTGVKAGVLRFKNGLLDGRQEYYDQNGELRAVQQHRNGFQVSD